MDMKTYESFERLYHAIFELGSLLHQIVSACLPRRAFNGMLRMCEGDWSSLIHDDLCQVALTHLPRRPSIL